MGVRLVLRPMLVLANLASASASGSGSGSGTKAPGVSVAERRAASARDPLGMRTVTARGVHPVTTQDHRAPVDGAEILVRIYRAAGGPEAQPAHLYLHGGSFWLGSVEEYDPICRYYAAEAGCTVVSVDYRLAPEHPYPTGLEDAYAALGWLVSQAGALGVDPGRITVGGFSAGGGLAASLAMLARDRDGPDLVGQMLEAPILDLTLSTRSMTELGTGYRLTRASLVQAYGFYLPRPEQAREPYASPLLADDLAGLPPAYIQTSECDPLRDEGEAYGARLRSAGVAAVVYRVPGHLHGSIYLTRVLPSARRAVRRTAAALRSMHTGGHQLP